MWGGAGTPPPSDRWAVILALLDLRVRALAQSQWPCHVRLAWLAPEEVALQAFDLGMRWAELDGLVGAVGSGAAAAFAPLPSLIADIPSLAESFSAGYGAAIDHPVDDSDRLLLSVFQAAEYLGRPEHDLLMLMREGVLACQWYGGERRVSFKDLEAHRIRGRDDEARAYEALLAVGGMIERKTVTRAA